MQAPDHRAEMLARLGRLLDARAARAGPAHAARERIDLLLDRDSPFLELCPLAAGDAVVGIGVIERTVCVVAAGAAEPVDPLDAKVRRAMAVAADCALPAVVLDDLSGDLEPIRRHRHDVRWRHRRARGRPPAPAAAEPPRADADGLLDVPEPHEIVRHVVDGSRIDAGWATIGGLPVAVVTGADDPPDDAPRDADPVLRVTSSAVPGSAPSVSVRVAAGRRGFTFAWPGPGLEPATAVEHDGVIDPRDTRIVVGIARWCLEC
jgi:hypothetical protein